MQKFTTIILILAFAFIGATKVEAQDFQGKAYYFSKTTMDMSRFGRGRQMNEQEKKQMEDRLKSMFEKTYVLTFNKEESIFIEEEKLAAPGAGRGMGMFGSSFSPGPQYKNIKESLYLQDQEFFGKQFLIKEELEPIEWVMGTETKQIGQYLCFKATAKKRSTQVNIGPPPRRENTETKTDSIKPIEDADKKEEENMIDVVAWYTPQIPVSQGPSEFWGLPGLILEISAGNNTMLCTKIVINPEEKTKIVAPKKGEEVTKQEYNEIITAKMEEFRANRRRGGGGRR